MRYYFFLLAFISIVSLSAQPAIGLEEYATGFNRPVDVAHVGDNRIFVVEQDGVIKIIEDGNVLSTPFLDIDSRVRSSGNEQGLLGLAFHPDYANNGWFFVNYINNSGNTQVSRFSVSSADPNVADSNSELMILPANQPYSNHNGGCIKFGQDGFLYIGLGDGGSGGDPDGYGQNRQSFLGKMLRIDVNNSSDAAPYEIPATNPFANDDFTLDEIWHIGLRNPWRFSFDRMTGDLWIGDVGQGNWEEIDFQPSDSEGGENYGWRCYEGNQAYNTSQCDGIEAYEPPVFEYPNSFSGGCAVTGGYVYRGTEIPDLVGYYLFADYCLGDIMSLLPDGTGGWQHDDLLETSSYVSAFGEDASGELYMADLFGGIIYKIVEACAAVSINVNIDNESCEGQSDGSITLDVPNGSSILWASGSTDNPLVDLEAGMYSAVITTVEGCESPINAEVISESPALLSPTISQNNNDLSVPQDYDSYQWYLAGNPIEGATQSTYNITESGTYFVIVGSDSGCMVFSNILPVELVSTLEILDITALEVTPVPFKNNFHLNLNTATPGDYTFTLFTLNGETVFSFEQQISTIFSKNIEMERWSSGSYILMIERDGKTFTKRLVKQ